MKSKRKKKSKLLYPAKEANLWGELWRLQQEREELERRFVALLFRLRYE